MAVECAYSFWHLFESAYGRVPSEEEKQSFLMLSQKLRNEKVAKWAHVASWETDNRIGTDGQKYLAFAPSFSPKE